MQTSTPVLLWSLLLSSCAAAPDRPSDSSAGCAQAAIDRHLPAGLPDKQAHCVAGALIARYCSPAEARLAGLGKELRDAFGAGDAEWVDWRATRAGVRCAEAHSNVAAVVSCCQNAARQDSATGDDTP